MNWSGGAWPPSKIPAKSSPTHTRDTPARRSVSERYSLAKTPDLAKRVSTLGSLSPQRSQLRRKEPEPASSDNPINQAVVGLTLMPLDARILRLDRPHF